MSNPPDIIIVVLLPFIFIGLFAAGCWLTRPNIEKLKGEKNIPGLVDALRNTSNDCVNQAIAALRELALLDVKPLCACLKNEVGILLFNQIELVHILGKIGNREAVPFLIQALGYHADSLEFAQIAGSFLKSSRWDSSEWLPFLRSYLDAGYIPQNLKLTIASMAARSLGKIGDSAAVPHLVALLKSDDPVLAWCATDALLRIGDADSLKAVEDAHAQALIDSPHTATDIEETMKAIKSAHPSPTST